MIMIMINTRKDEVVDFSPFLTLNGYLYLLISLAFSIMHMGRCKLNTTTTTTTATYTCKNSTRRNLMFSWEIKDIIVLAILIERCSSNSSRSNCQVLSPSCLFLSSRQNLVLFIPRHKFTSCSFVFPFCVRNRIMYGVRIKIETMYN